MYKFRTRLSMSLAILLLLSLAMVRELPAATPEEPLTQAMEATGAHFNEYSINAWAKLPDEAMNDNQLQETVEKIMEQLDVSAKDYQLTQQQRGTHRTVQAEAIRPEWHAFVAAQVIPKQGDSSQMETYLVVNMESIVNENTSIQQLQRKISDSIKKNGGSPKINTCLIGWLGGKLVDGEQQRVLEKAFMAIDGVIIDKLKAENFLSYTGFSSIAGEWLQVGDKKVNINIATRYSQYDNRTYVIIGSPIITKEY
ncbi:YwmB family TATA-box binding protein [Pelosinus sp. UFO1]|uniref:YwmB family TATA-box binding protein n=1 Tax=Pelosinus sp. UFO1 TaxID=484770 RepID=UPI0004D147DE|nr:YwmB family TATA-box binding protein [Pelosinus sp. UFO1]AIF53800.1 protein of unknown function DUF1779 [Pelosinus sp. UFO1]